METFDLMLEKLRAFCAYQDRAHSEARKKLHQLGVWGNDEEEIIAALITEGFLNEERYARNYARGKFRTKNWGRRKIEYNLELKQVSPYCIRKGLEEIDEEDYTNTIKKLAARRDAMMRTLPPGQRHHRIKEYLISKGFEPDLVRDTLNTLKENQ